MNWKIYIDLKYMDCNQLCDICNEMKNKCAVDVKKGRYVVDGTSLLGVMSLAGNEVELVPITSDEDVITEFYDKAINIGAYIKNH